MDKGIWWALGIWLCAAPQLFAQIFPIPPAPRDTSEWSSLPNATTRHAIFEPAEGIDAAAFGFFARVEYLLGWVEQSPLPIPVATSGDSKNKHPGAIGQTGTTVLRGNQGIGFGEISGLRIALGGWIDPQQTMGLEGRGFVFQRRSNDFSATSTDANNPLLALPFSNQTPGSSGESAQLISKPKVSVGNLLVASSLQRWGMEVNGMYAFWRQPNLEVTLLSGFCHQDLQENLRLETSTKTTATKTMIDLNDRFGTRNQFYGAQIGSRIFWQRDVMFLELTDTVALGSTHQVVDIQGDSERSGPKVSTSGTFPGGFFAQPSNIGRTMANPFTVIPSLEMKLGLQITPRLRSFVSYEILYWNQVVRPGNQIDRNINLSQSTVLGTAGGVLSGPALPAPFFQRSDFWAQAVSVGLELRY